MTNIDQALVWARNGRNCRLFTSSGEDLPAVLSGALARAAAADPLAHPAVGDRVMFARSVGLAVIGAVGPRASLFVRKRAGAVAAVQVVAANVTSVFVVTDAGGDFNLRRLERYLVQAWDAGAAPALLINKADQASGAPDLAERARRLGAPAHAISAATGAGLDDLASYLGPGALVALVGSSGVGKSTLANALLGHDCQRTGAVRALDGKGRHTTTDRRLLRLPGGAWLLDTPGMRELGLWADEEAVEEAFPDVRELARGCRFRDCRHETEPGCRVREAVAAGDLAPERAASHARLAREAARVASRRARRR